MSKLAGGKPGGAIRVATAGWAIPRAVAGAFPETGKALERYAAVFDAAEINSSFHRPHRPSTYARWAEAAGPGFRFSVKLPKAVTHLGALAPEDDAVGPFLAETGQLGAARGPILVQTPPRLAFDQEAMERLAERLRRGGAEAIACEPRHASWFSDEADGVLAALGIARVAADPARHGGAERPGGWRGLSYHRLHGSPRMYYSAYGEEALAALAQRLLADPAPEVWCVFDNTASGAAAADALALKARLAKAWNALNTQGLPGHGRRFKPGALA